MRLAVLGSGVSGLTAAYFARQRAAVTLVIFMQITGKLGGWAETQDGFEVGPRTINMTQAAPIVLEIAAKLGMLNELITTKARFTDFWIYNKGSYTPVKPYPPFGLAKLLLRSGLHRRTFLKNYRRPAPQQNLSEDMSIADFVKHILQFATPEDAQEFIHIYPNAMQMFLTAGNVYELSAKSYRPFSTYYVDAKQLPAATELKEVLEFEDNLRRQRTTAFAFQHGFSNFITRWVEYLKGSGVTIVDDYVTEIKTDSKGKPLVILKDSSPVECHKVISTMPSHQLATRLVGFPEITMLAQQIPHNSVYSITLEFQSKPNLSGTGYACVDPDSTIKACNYVFNAMPQCGNLIRIVAAPRATPQETLNAVVAELKTHTKLRMTPTKATINYLDQALPQHTVGHTERLRQIEQALPDWLRVAGHSFYSVGVPHTMLATKDVVERFLS